MTEQDRTMRAVRIHTQAGPEALVVEEASYPHTAENDVVIRVHAAGFTPGELDWPSTWKDRAGRDRGSVIPGHEVSGEVAGLGIGTTGLTVGQRVFGLTDWTRDGTLAEYVAVEARNLAPLPGSIDHIRGAALPMAGLTAWQALFDHACLWPGQTVLVHGAAGAVGDMAVQLAREAGPASSAQGGSGTARPWWKPAPNVSPSSTQSTSRRSPDRWMWCWTQSAGTCCTGPRRWSGPAGPSSR
jgi:NADPH:quinone reductase-like Zn-dependent oxidoreductase